ncbi:MAG TPA: hypothetical protein VJ836_06880 [Candidatus Saccharimonadales bacterium]|nr:hypothetical protein [Candidatus Saccharimonadales bacterium]
MATHIPIFLSSPNGHRWRNVGNTDKFPLVEDFELVLFDGRQNPPEKSLGSDIMAHFVNDVTNQRIMYLGHVLHRCKT